MILTIYIFLAILVTWALFLMYCALHASIKSGKFKATPLPVKALSCILFTIMLVGDIGFNLTVGSLLFAELPNIRRPTFTQRCSDHITDEDWRGRLAKWICTGWLNPFEDDHC